MDHRLRVIPLLFVLLFISLVPNSGQVDTALHLNQTIPDIEVVDLPTFRQEFTIPTNIIFLGFDESKVEINAIDREITKWFIPLIETSGDIFGANITFEMNYLMPKNTSMIENYAQFLIDSSATANVPEEFEENYDDQATTGLFIDADAAINWLDGNVDEYLNVTDGYTIYFIDTWTENLMGEYYFYEHSLEDPDTGDNYEPYTIIYGGNNRSLFLDLSAGPVYFQEDFVEEENEGVSDETITPIWEYTNEGIANSILNNDIAEYIQETIDFTFASNYLYQPVYKDEVLIDVVIFDDASVTVVNQINTTIIQESFSELLPYSDVNVSLRVTSVLDEPEVETVITQNQVQGVVDPIAVGEYFFNKPNYFRFNSYPMVIFAWDNPDLWLTGVGVTGNALGDQNNVGAIALSGYDPIVYDGDGGYSYLTIHEVGHLIGLSHVHEGLSWDYFNDTGESYHQDWLRSFLKTPMGYAHFSVSFNQFEFDMMDRAYSYLFDTEAWLLLQQANRTLVGAGFNDKKAEIEPTEMERLFNTLEWVFGNRSTGMQQLDSLEYLAAFSSYEAVSDAATLYSIFAQTMNIPGDDEQTLTIYYTSPRNTGQLLFFVPAVGMSMLVILKRMKRTL